VVGLKLERWITLFLDVAEILVVTVTDRSVTPGLSAPYSAGRAHDGLFVPWRRLVLVDPAETALFFN